MCVRSGATAADESRVPEPAVAAGDGWNVYPGCRCEARYLASDPDYQLWQTKWYPGTIAAIWWDTLTCKVLYDDGDVEERVLLQHVRQPPPEPPRAPRPHLV